MYELTEPCMPELGYCINLVFNLMV